MVLTEEQLQTLRHTLGIDTPDERAPKAYRNYFCANRGDTDLAERARLGAVRLYRQCDHYDWYTTTGAGRAAARASHRTIRLPKSKRIYSRYLDVADVHAHLTFHEFLTSPTYAETRAAA